MRYAEAFKALGYHIASPRQHWSAASDTGVCLSIWRREIKQRDGLPSLDTRVDANPIETWGHDVGNRTRIEHLKIARDKFGSYVDIVIVSGVPGESYDDADPWIPAKRRGARWKVSWFDPQTGHFAASAVAS